MALFDLESIDPASLPDPPVGTMLVYADSTNSDLPTARTNGPVDTVMASTPGVDVDGVVQTVDATPTVAASYTTQANDRGISLKGVIHGYEPATQDHLVASFTARAHRDGGGTVTVENIHFDNGPDFDPGAVAWGVNLVPVGSDIQFQVTGEAAHTIDWRAWAIVRESAG